MPLTKTCAISGAEFIVTDEDLAFYEKMGVNPPMLSPDERWRRRLSWRHSGELFRDKCALTGESIISMYSPEKNFKVYSQASWWGDNWDALDYGRDFDFSRPAFPQVMELAQVVPKIALVNTNTQNSFYTNHTINQKNCHLIFGGADNEDCIYGYFVQGCQDVVDSDSVVDCELCFDIIASLNCYRCVHTADCQNCSDCFLIQDCIGCQDCIACIGLTQKKYHILNKPYSQADYEKIKADLKLHEPGKREVMIDKFEALKAKSVYEAAHLYNCEDCIGDHLFNCRNMEHCFDCKASEDCKYVSFTPNGLDSYDCTFSAPVGVQHCYETISTLGQEMMGCMLVWHSNNVYYSLECHNSHDLLACAGLRSQQHCILNKAYTVQGYETLKTKIISHMKETGEWGEFFAVKDSPYAYNHSLANTLFPLSKNRALERGYIWQEVPKETKQPDATLLKCAETGKPYQVSPAEAHFYKKMGLATPTTCPEVRKEKRLKYRNVRALYERICGNCDEKIHTTFAPERQEKVYCKNCYLERRV